MKYKRRYLKLWHRKGLFQKYEIQKTKIHQPDFSNADAECMAVARRCAGKENVFTKMRSQIFMAAWPSPPQSDKLTHKVWSAHTEHGSAMKKKQGSY